MILVFQLNNYPRWSKLIKINLTQTIFVRIFNIINWPPWTCGLAQTSVWWETIMIVQTTQRWRNTVLGPPIITHNGTPVPTGLPSSAVMERYRPGQWPGLSKTSNIQTLNQTFIQNGNTVKINIHIFVSIHDFILLHEIAKLSLSVIFNVASHFVQHWHCSIGCKQTFIAS